MLKKSVYFIKTEKIVNSYLEITLSKRSLIKTVLIQVSFNWKTEWNLRFMNFTQETVVALSAFQAQL